MPETAKNSQADTVSSLKNPSYGKDFLEEVNEALIYQRLGVDKDKIAEHKAAIEKLTEKIQQQGGMTN